MRLVRYEYTGRVGYGRVEGETVRPLAGPPWEGLQAAGLPAPLGAVRLLAPVNPSKVVAIGLNYHDHIKEGPHQLPQEPLFFLKPGSAVIGPGEPILIPGWVGRVDHEAELGVVIGRTAKNVARERAREYILGLTCLNDVTARDLQRGDGQWTRGKGFDTFCPLGPWIETDLDYSDLGVRAEVNGRLAQNGRTGEMIFPVDLLIAHVTRVMTLFPGDVIATGTPAGISPLQPGDEVVIEIEGIGRLVSPVAGA